MSNFRILITGAALGSMLVASALPAAAASVAPVLPSAATPRPRAAALSAPRRPAVSPQDQALLKTPTLWLRGVFRVPSGLPVDPELRAAARAISDEHLERIEALLPQWLADARTALPANASDGQAVGVLYARLSNELTLWRMEVGKPTHDQVWLTALQQPAACAPGDQGSQGFFALELLAMQQIPPAQWADFLKDERELLSHWGQPRHHLMEVPLFSVDEQVNAAAAQVKAGIARNLPPMIPVLSARLLDGFNADTSMTWSDRCAQAQWWLRQQALDTDAHRQSAFAAFLYELAPNPLASAKDEEVPGDGRLPFSATRYGVQGTVKLQLRVDANGVLQHAEVVERAIEVPGLHNPPLAFARLLDKAALQRARHQHFDKPAPDRLQDDMLTLVQSYTFKAGDAP